MESSAGADFDTFRWHDCSIWAFEFRVGDSSENDWTSDLALDIDYIIEWIPDSGGSARFRVAPAALVFHGVNDPKIDVTWTQSGFQVALRPLSIARVQRKLIPDAKVYMYREY